jgi:uncharacterized protein
VIRASGRRPTSSDKATRRRFLQHAGALAGGIVTSTTLSILAAHAASAGDTREAPQARRGRGTDYGELQRTPDIDGRMILALPKGFQYSTCSRTGEAYAAGLAVPRNHDGMACFARSGDVVRLIRNHELRNAAGDFSLGVSAPAHLQYDALAMGGCMTLDFDKTKKRLLRQFVSLGGTLVNCAGGWSYRNEGWISCEETTFGIQQGYARPHGYSFFVPANADSAVAAVPLKALGRFVKEAAVADDSGIVYQTEDAGDSSGFYRFTPDRPGDLRSGKLQMLGIRGKPGADLYQGQTTGTRLPVVWLDVGTPDPDLENGAASCFAQARARGGAAFNRLEGIFRGADRRSIYFVSTSGGERRAPGRGYGQLWQYIPAESQTRGNDELVLVFESPSGSVLESPDNLCVTPSGGILLCEDDAVADADTHPLAGPITNVNRLIGMSPGGVTFTFAVNILNSTEFAGACFSPDAEMLFVNIYGDATHGSGMTCAIWGPWDRGPL